jgi:hypothetical protein
LIERLVPPPDPELALRDAGLEPSAWSAAPFTHFAPHQHASSKRLFVVEGDIAFNGEWLHAPAAIRIAARTEHHADVGERGVRCVEAFE